MMRMTKTLSLLGLLLFGLGCGQESAPSGGLEETHQGKLEEGDLVLEQDGSFYDPYAFEARAGDRITLEMTSEELDPYLALYDSEAKQLAKNDDIGLPNRNARVVFTAPRDDTYTVAANTYEGGETGAYTLSIKVEPAASEVTTAQ